MPFKQNSETRTYVIIRRKLAELPLSSRALRRFERIGSRCAQARSCIFARPTRTPGSARLVPDTAGRCRLRRGGRCGRSRSRVTATAALHREEAGEADDEEVEGADGHFSSDV